MTYHYNLDELRQELEDVRAECKVLNDDIIGLNSALMPYWEKRRQYRALVWSSLNTTINNETGKTMLIGFLGERVRKISSHWIGPAERVDGGHCEPCMRDVIEVEQGDFRRHLHAQFTEVHDEYRPLLRHRRTVQADLNAGLRRVNVILGLIERAQNPSQKRHSDTDGGQLGLL